MDKEDVVYIHKGILFSYKKKMKILPFAGAQIKGIMLSEINQTEKDKYCVISFICEI